MLFRGIVMLVLVASVTCVTWLHIPVQAADDRRTDATVPPEVVPLFEGLGDFGRKVTTTSPDAQKYFNQGLSFLYAFNHDEAIRSFEQAARFDPKCAMAWWGISIANGPHINNPMLPPDRAASAWNALVKAREFAAQGTPIEQALIQALSARYADPSPDDRKALDEAYAEAMRKVWTRHTEDADVCALCAEALMDLHPWDFFTANHDRQPWTSEIEGALRSAMNLNPTHPLALHLYIHAVEASAYPQAALVAAEQLRTLQPGLGHMVHMPSHIDVRLGRWEHAIAANQKAIAADKRYREISQKQEFYRIYMAHNHHMLTFAAMMRGQSELAISSIKALADAMPADWIKANPMMADGFAAQPLEVLVRFGRWDDILAAPEPPEYLPLTRAMRHCARGIALAAKDQLDQAKVEQQAFLAAKEKVPAESMVGNNKGTDILAIAQHLLAGEILVKAGKTESELMSAGLNELRLAVKAEDSLRYSEPPDWNHPVRHALGANLIALGQFAEAEEVYRQDLKRVPNNGWSLFGLYSCLRRKPGAGAEAGEVYTQFLAVWRDADIKITSSCFCQPGMK